VVAVLHFGPVPVHVGRRSRRINGCGGGGTGGANYCASPLHRRFAVLSPITPISSSAWTVKDVGVVAEFPLPLSFLLCVQTMTRASSMTSPPPCRLLKEGEELSPGSRLSLSGL